VIAGYAGLEQASDLARGRGGDYVDPFDQFKRQKRS